MGAEKDIIVAVELSSTSIRAIAGKRKPDGNMQVLAFAEERGVNAIRKGNIDNIDKTTQAISTTVRRLSDQLGVEVRRIYVGLGGQSVHTERNVVQESFSEKTKVTNEIVDEIHDVNSSIEYPNSCIMEVIPQEFRIGNRSEMDVVGLQCEHLEVVFLNVVARRDLKENIELCVRNAGLELVEILNAPLCLAEGQLTSSERHSGCALVNIGASTTTIAVYKSDILRHLVVIPLGSGNATADIASSLSLDLDEAEAFKRKYGTAYFDENGTAESTTINASYGRSVSEEDIKNYTAARYEEIICNVGAQLTGRDDLISGIVLTGGGAQASNLEEAFKQYIKWQGNINLRKGLPANVEVGTGVKLPDVNLLHTLIALVQKGDQNCIAEQPVPQEQEPDYSALTEIPTEEEEASEVATDPDIEVDEEEQTEPKQGPSLVSKIKRAIRKVKEWFEKVLTPDEEE